jgi:hypothetical protein
MINKRGLAFFLVVFFSLGSLGNRVVHRAAAGSSLNTGLVAYWKMDAASGTRVDSVGSNHLAITNGTVNAVTGKLNNAVEFDLGPNGVIGAADHADLSITGDYTISFWFQHYGSQSSHVQRKFYLGWVLQMNLTVLELILNDSVSGSVTATTAALTGSTWYHIVAWYDSADKKVRLRVNDTTTYTSPTALSNGPADTTEDFEVGGGGGSYFWGKVDEMGLWQRLLTAGEITTLYNGGGTPPTLP